MQGRIRRAQASMRYAPLDISELALFILILPTIGRHRHALHIDIDDDCYIFIYATLAQDHFHNFSFGTRSYNSLSLASTYAAIFRLYFL